MVCLRSLSLTRPRSLTTDAPPAPSTRVLSHPRGPGLVCSTYLAVSLSLSTRTNTTTLIRSAALYCLHLSLSLSLSLSPSLFHITFARDGCLVHTLRDGGIDIDAGVGSVWARGGHDLRHDGLHRHHDSSRPRSLELELELLHRYQTHRQ